jgi:hypothetical protein
MKLWKRFALLTLVAGLLGGTVLSGCGGSDDDDTTNTADNAVKKDKTDADGE